MLSDPMSIVTVEFSMNLGEHLYLWCGILLYGGDNNSKLLLICVLHVYIWKLSKYVCIYE